MPTHLADLEIALNKIMTQHTDLGRDGAVKPPEQGQAALSVPAPSLGTVQVPTQAQVSALAAPSSTLNSATQPPEATVNVPVAAPAPSAVVKRGRFSIRKVAAVDNAEPSATGAPPTQKAASTSVSAAEFDTAHKALTAKEGMGSSFADGTKQADVVDSSVVHAINHTVRDHQTSVTPRQLAVLPSADPTLHISSSQPEVRQLLARGHDAAELITNALDLGYKDVRVGQDVTVPDGYQAMAPSAPGPDTQPPSAHAAPSSREALGVGSFVDLSPTTPGAFMHHLVASALTAPGLLPAGDGVTDDDELSHSGDGAEQDPSPDKVSGIQRVSAAARKRTILEHGTSEASTQHNASITVHGKSPKPTCTTDSTLNPNVKGSLSALSLVAARKLSDASTNTSPNPLLSPLRPAKRPNTFAFPLLKLQPASSVRTAQNVAETPPQNGRSREEAVAKDPFPKTVGADEAADREEVLEGAAHDVVAEQPGQQKNVESQNICVCEDKIEVSGTTESHRQKLEGQEIANAQLDGGHAKSEQTYPGKTADIKTVDNAVERLENVVETEDISPKEDGVGLSESDATLSDQPAEQKSQGVDTAVDTANSQQTANEALDTQVVNDEKESQQNLEWNKYSIKPFIPGPAQTIDAELKGHNVCVSSEASVSAGSHFETVPEQSGPNLSTPSIAEEEAVSVAKSSVQDAHPDPNEPRESMSDQWRPSASPAIGIIPSDITSPDDVPLFSLSPRSVISSRRSSALDSGLRTPATRDDQRYLTVPSYEVSHPRNLQPLFCGQYPLYMHGLGAHRNMSFPHSFPTAQTDNKPAEEQGINRQEIIVEDFGPFQSASNVASDHGIPGIVGDPLLSPSESEMECLIGSFRVIPPVPMNRLSASSTSASGAQQDEQVNHAGTADSVRSRESSVDATSSSAVTEAEIEFRCPSVPEVHRSSLSGMETQWRSPKPSISTLERRRVSLQPVVADPEFHLLLTRQCLQYQALINLFKHEQHEFITHRSVISDAAGSVDALGQSDLQAPSPNTPRKLQIAIPDHAVDVSSVSVPTAQPQLIPNIASASEIQHHTHTGPVAIVSSAQLGNRHVDAPVPVAPSTCASMATGALGVLASHPSGVHADLHHTHSASGFQTPPCDRSYLVADGQMRASQTVVQASQRSDLLPATSLLDLSTTASVRQGVAVAQAPAAVAQRASVPSKEAAMDSAHPVPAEGTPAMSEAVPHAEQPPSKRSQDSLGEKVPDGTETKGTVDEVSVPSNIAETGLASVKTASASSVENRQAAPSGPSGSSMVKAAETVAVSVPETTKPAQTFVPIREKAGASEHAGPVSAVSVTASVTSQLSAGYDSVLSQPVSTADVKSDVMAVPNHTLTATDPGTTPAVFASTTVTPSTTAPTAVVHPANTANICAPTTSITTIVNPVNTTASEAPKPKLLTDDLLKYLDFTTQPEAPQPSQKKISLNEMRKKQQWGSGSAESNGTATPPVSSLNPASTAVSAGIGCVGLSTVSGGLRMTPPRHAQPHLVTQAAVAITCSAALATIATTRGAQQAVPSGIKTPQPSAHPATSTLQCLATSPSPASHSTDIKPGTTQIQAEQAPVAALMPSSHVSYNLTWPAQYPGQAGLFQSAQTDSNAQNVSFQNQQQRPAVPSAAVTPQRSTTPQGFSQIPAQHVQIPSQRPAILGGTVETSSLYGARVIPATQVGAAVIVPAAPSADPSRVLIGSQTHVTGEHPALIGQKLPASTLPSPQSVPVNLSHFHSAPQAPLLPPQFAQYNPVAQQGLTPGQPIAASLIPPSILQLSMLPTAVPNPIAMDASGVANDRRPSDIPGHHFMPVHVPVAIGTQPDSLALNADNPFSPVQPNLPPVAHAQTVPGDQFSTGHAIADRRQTLPFISPVHILDQIQNTLLLSPPGAAGKDPTPGQSCAPVSGSLSPPGMSQPPMS